jgi:hypothetical protein
VIYDLFGQPMVLNTDGTVVTPGNRILEVTLDDGTPVVLQGVAVPGLTLDIATLGFLATGGDQYFDKDYLSKSYATDYTLLGITDQNALQDYITSFNNADIGNDSRYDLAQKAGSRQCQSHAAPCCSPEDFWVSLRAVAGWRI